MVNSTLSVTTTSQTLIPPTEKIGLFIATNLGTNPVYIRYSQSWPAVAGEGICLYTTGSSVVLEQPTNDAVSLISSGGSSTISYFYA